MAVAAGPGSDPYRLSGPVFLTGPYNGAPYGLAIVVPAKAGPFDLGTVVVRQALTVDPLDAHVTARMGESRVFEADGSLVRTVPGQIRRWSAGCRCGCGRPTSLDRPGFSLNPTSCAEKRVASSVLSLAGALAEPSVRFQVADCAALGFEPKLSLRLRGRPTAPPTRR